MPWWTWIAFGIFLLALVAAAVFAAFAFGRLKRLSAAAEGIQARLDEVARAAENVAFYTGTQLSGDEIPATLDAPGTCRNLPAPALSGLNYAVNHVEVYYNADCRTGAPGASGDAYYVLGSLHTGNFPYAAASYRVLPAN